jgi:hypothetical protein
MIPASTAWLAWMSVILGGPTITVEPPKLTGRAVEQADLFQREIDQAVAAHAEPAVADAQYRLRVSVEEDARDYQIRFELLDAAGASVATATSSCDICAEGEAAAQSGRDLAAFLAANLTATAATSVHVTSDPSGARVLVDGNEVGTTPYEAAIEPGEHTVVVEQDGYRSTTRGFTAAEGKTSEMHVELQERSGARPRSTAEPNPKVKRGAWIGGWVGIGVGIGLLTTGIALLAIDGNDIKSDCSGANIDAFGNCKYRYETTGGGAAATVLGLAFAGAGTGLVIWSRPKKGGQSLAAHIGPTRVGLTMRF